jgi:hypothetical protein
MFMVFYVSGTLSVIREITRADACPTGEKSAEEMKYSPVLANFAAKINE